MADSVSLTLPGYTEYSVSDVTGWSVLEDVGQRVGLFDSCVLKKQTVEHVRTFVTQHVKLLLQVKYRHG